ncbi:hypothetical protein [Glaesserella sp.]|uniref:hypothetical protein n=1 Tax=Glaesserella sp. TaxID=2094731 RepID=UPI0035A09536
MELSKKLLILSTIITMVASLFTTVNLLYGVISTLLAIFFAIEDKGNIYLHIHQKQSTK